MAKILLADDSTHAQRMGTKILAAEGHEVSTVSNGQAAIHFLEQNVPELVIADVFMPGRNGYEVCHYVKTEARLKHIPVLLIVGAMEPYDPEEGRRAGADGMITKPLESSNLVTTVKDLLAAAKRFAPARAVARETASGNVVMETVIEEPVEEETPQWDETVEAEILTPARAEKLEIPQELSQQPIGVLTDYLSSAEPGAPPALEIELEPAPALGSPAEMPAELSLEPAGSTPQASEPSSLLTDPGLAPQLDIAEQTVWTAEQAEVTAEDARLFEQATPNWGDLEQLVEQSAAPEPSPAPLPWQMPSATEPPPQTGFMGPAAVVAGSISAEPAIIEPDPLLIQMQPAPAETGTEPEIEHYEDLSEATVAHPEPPVPRPEPIPEPAATAEEAAPAPFPGPVEELEAAPAERNIPPLEQLVRQAVEDLMPEIIERVKRSLKN